jgi:predicted Zn-ribbon and HTH transcriptional regulator
MTKRKPTGSVDDNQAEIFRRLVKSQVKIFIPHHCPECGSKDLELFVLAQAAKCHDCKNYWRRSETSRRS